VNSTQASTALADERQIRTQEGALGVYARLAGDAGLEGLQRVGERLAARYAVKDEVWVWMWAWDMDTEGPAACLSYARPGLGPLTEWMDPSRVASWYMVREVQQRGMTVN